MKCICDIDKKMLFANLSPPRQKLLLRVSALLNLCLLLYLSLSAGWSVASVSPVAGPLTPITRETEDLAQHQTFSRGILNKYFGKLDHTSLSVSFSISIYSRRYFSRGFEISYCDNRIKTLIKVIIILIHVNIFTS